MGWVWWEGLLIVFIVSVLIVLLSVRLRIWMIIGFFLFIGLFLCICLLLFQLCVFMVLCQWVFCSMKWWIWCCGIVGFMRMLSMCSRRIFGLGLVWRFLFIWVLSFFFVCVRICRCIVLFVQFGSVRSIWFVVCVMIGLVVYRFWRRSVCLCWQCG